MEKSNWVFVKGTKVMLTSGLAYKITSTLQFSIGAYMRQGFEPKKACRPVIGRSFCSVRCPVRSCDPWTVSIVPPAKGPFSGTILLSCGFWYENVCWDSPLSEPLMVMTTGPGCDICAGLELTHNTENKTRNMHTWNLMLTYLIWRTKTVNLTEQLYLVEMR